MHSFACLISQAQGVYFKVDTHYSSDPNIGSTPAPATWTPVRRRRPGGPTASAQPLRCRRAARTTGGERGQKIRPVEYSVEVRIAKLEEKMTKQLGETNELLRQLMKQRQ